MIADALDPDRLARMAWLTPAAALAASLAKAQARLTIGGRAVRDDGTQGTIRAITSDGYLPIVEVVTDDNRLVREPAGHWNRSAL